MLSIYVGGLLFGGVLLAASILGGHAEHGDLAAHGAGTQDGGGDGPSGGHGLPFLSLRFWAFTLAFFGLTGVALTFTGRGLGALVPALAGAVGLSCGLVSARVLRLLGRRPVGLLGDAGAHVGREGRVLLPVGLSKGQRGKIRLQIGGTSTDLVAETDSDAGLAAGETALVVGIRGNVALVERSPGALPPARGGRDGNGDGNGDGDGKERP
jgi:membrane protein implicated in regulation of membrane protease activity